MVIIIAIVIVSGVACCYLNYCEEVLHHGLLSQADIDHYLYSSIVTRGLPTISYSHDYNYVHAYMHACMIKL